MRNIVGVTDLRFRSIRVFYPPVGHLAQCSVYRTTRPS